MCERCFGQQTNLDRHLKKHEMDGQGGGDGANCSSVLSASPEASSSPEGCGSGSAELMMMQQLIPSAAGRVLPGAMTGSGDASAASASANYFADIRKFMGQVTADSLMAANFHHHHHHHRHHHHPAAASDDELSQDDASDRGPSGPVRLEITS